MPLDPKKYALANQPWRYEQVAATLKHWGYEPAGDHSPACQLDLDGFLLWEKNDVKNVTKRLFVISKPRWRTHGFSEPVWPASVVRNALVRQEVFHQTGADGDDGDEVMCVEIPLTVK